MNSDDILIDFNHLFNIVLNQLIKNFPKSKIPFIFKNIYDNSNLDELSYDDSYYFFKSLVLSHSDFFRQMLKQEGIVEDADNDTKLTDKGLEIVETGDFKQYITNKERQKQLEHDLKESMITANKSVIRTNDLQRKFLWMTLVVAVLGLVVSLCSCYVSYLAYKKPDSSSQCKHNSPTQQQK